jgi:hypothetical protein
VPSKARQHKLMFEGAGSFLPPHDDPLDRLQSLTMGIRL